MGKQRESRRQARIRKTILKEYGDHAWFFKVHGGPFQSSGLPDLIGTVYGIFFGFEVKEPEDGEPTELQLETIADIIRAGGVAGIIEQPEEALALIREARRLSERRGIIRGTANWVCSILRAGYGKDVDRTWNTRIPEFGNRIICRAPYEPEDYLG
jgi:hypothetical protein